MKKISFKLIGLLIVIIMAFSCNSSTTTTNETNTDVTKQTEKTTETNNSTYTGPDYSGIYKASDGNTCGITITVTKTNDGFNYNLKTPSVDFNGKLNVNDQAGTLYFNFEGKIDDNTDGFSGQYNEGKLTFENYGNAMNQYQLFDDCDSKYIEFSR